MLANYPGRCAHCGDEIEPGKTEIEWSDDEGGWVLAEHLGQEHVIQEDRDICPKCRMARAANGACLCE